MPNVFEARQNMRQHHEKEQPEEPVIPLDGETVLGISKKKPKNSKTYALYLNNDLMDQVKRLAKRQGVSASVMVEACIKTALEQMDG